MKLTKHYINTISRDFILKHNLKNVMHTPRIDKLVIDTSTGAAIQDLRHLIPCVTALEAISGQKPKLTLSKKSIANFKLRENQIIGCKVTLRKERFFCFLQKIIYTVILQQNIDFVGKVPFSSFQVGVDSSSCQPIEGRSIIPREFSNREAIIVSTPKQSSNARFNRATLDNTDLPTYLPTYQSSIGGNARGAFGLGISNILVFPELENHYDLFNAIPGVNINFCSKNLLPYHLASMTHFLNLK